MPIGECCNGRKFADEAARLQAARLEIMNIVGIRIESGERTDCTYQHAHRMSIIPEALHETLDVFMDHRVSLDVLLPRRIVLAVRQFAFDDQISYFKIVAELR